MYNDKKGIISENAIPAMKTAIDKTNRFFFQIGFFFHDVNPPNFSLAKNKDKEL